MMQGHSTFFLNRGWYVVDVAPAQFQVGLISHCNLSGCGLTNIKMSGFNIVFH